MQTLASHYWICFHGTHRQWLPVKLSLLLHKNSLLSLLALFSGNKGAQKTLFYNRLVMWRMGLSFSLPDEFISLWTLAGAQNEHKPLTISPPSAPGGFNQGYLNCIFDKSLTYIGRADGTAQTCWEPKQTAECSLCFVLLKGMAFSPQKDTIHWSHWFEFELNCPLVMR